MSAQGIPNTIERQIEIAAPIERVWALVSGPGWWINEGEIREHEIEQAEGHAVVHDETHGAFPIETIELREPVYASFRWLASHDGEHGSAHIPTVVEFTLEPSDRGVMVRVVETGFAAGDEADAAARAAAHRDNSQGWDIELTAARAHLERV
ncbi:MAG TPA: SRPBCC domain-containing protein [Intrasporangium sp.]|uniref:SRPBCC domain-containing protein n=1 Tax=Intrasporangium sp. TaxID=1925024 RepID=UPI002B45AB2B|nr:SRPBCC domain-containing protein [Intrasporangium sp.]HKX68491.1 SRPBCC domain-containing protein [Intrasporangium sp.]